MKRLCYEEHNTFQKNSVLKKYWKKYWNIEILKYWKHYEISFLKTFILFDSSCSRRPPPVECWFRWFSMLVTELHLEKSEKVARWVKNWKNSIFKFAILNSIIIHKQDSFERTLHFFHLKTTGTQAQTTHNHRIKVLKGLMFWEKIIFFIQHIGIRLSVFVVFS